MASLTRQIINNQNTWNTSITNKEKKIITQAILLNNDKDTKKKERTPNLQYKYQKGPTSTKPTTTTFPKKRHTRNIPTVSFCFCDCFYTLKHLSIKPTYKGFTYLSSIKKKHTYTTTKNPTSAKLACLQNLNPPLSPFSTPLCAPRS